MSENKENISTDNGKKYGWLYGLAVVAFAVAMFVAGQFYSADKSDTKNSKEQKSSQQMAHEELTEQMYILETHKLNDIRNELRRANDLHERQLKQDSIRTELVRRQYLLDSARFASQCRKR